MTLTDQFISFVCSLQRGNISNSVYTYARTCVLDYSGVALAGAIMFSYKDHKYIQAISSSVGECSLIGLNAKTSIQNASLINGMSAHVIELDDGHRVGMLHLGAPVISAMLAVAEKEHLTTESFLYGIIVGYEVAIRLACAVQPGCKLRGYHATGTCGTVGVAMAVAAALHFDEEQMKSAFSAAVTSAAGVLEMIEGDTELKPYNAGRAAMDGLTAAYIGKARFRAPEDALGGKRGFLKIMTDEPKMQYLTEFVGGQYMIEQIYRKPYAACRHCHAPIEAVLSLNKENLKSSNIESIRVDTYKLAVAGHDHTEIKGENSAKMSIPYSVAVALIKHSAGMHEFEEQCIQNEEILELTKKVIVRENEELTALCPQKRVANVTIMLKGGQKLSARVDYPKGEPENPMTQEEIVHKFLNLALWSGVREDVATAIVEDVLYGDIQNVIAKL